MDFMSYKGGFYLFSLVSAPSCVLDLYCEFHFLILNTADAVHVLFLFLGNELNEVWGNVVG